VRDSEVILPLRAVPQPSPMLYHSGDCGACVLSGLLSKSVQEVYDFFKGKIEAFSRPSIRNALYKAEAHGLIDRYIHNVPTWDVPDSVKLWGSPSWLMNIEWFKYIQMAIDAGYYGICNVSLDPQSAGHPGDHFVMICGTKVICPESVGSIRQELFISCSARHPEGKWINSLEFLRNHGGFNVLLVRPVLPEDETET